MSSTTTLIQRYYTLLNERRFDELPALFTDDAVLEQSPFHSQLRGPAAFVAFAQAWVSAFPDAVFTIEAVTSRDPQTHEISLLATGTHRGPLELGGWVFKPTGTHAILRLREILEMRDGRIAFASLSFDLQEIVEQLSKVDCSLLLRHLGHIRQLGDQLSAVRDDPVRARELIDRIGVELDAARHAVRPYFKR